jgi:hypothetical protein
MTDDRIALQDLLESSDASLLREMIGFAAQRLMALKTDALCGAGHGELTPGHGKAASPSPRSTAARQRHKGKDTEAVAREDDARREHETRPIQRLRSAVLMILPRQVTAIPNTKSNRCL